MIISCCSAAGQHQKEPVTVCFIPSLQIFVYIDEIPSDPSLLQAKESHFSQSFHTHQMIQSLTDLSGHLLDFAQHIHVFLALESPGLDSTLCLANKVINAGVKPYWLQSQPWVQDAFLHH